MNFLPTVIEKTSSGERAYDIGSRLLKDRIVTLNGQVDDNVASVIVSCLLYLQAEYEGEDITFYINSPGGYVTAGMAIYDTMQHITNDVSTVVLGQACSMGSLLASAGAPGKRFILPNSTFMIHQPLGGASGQETDVTIQADRLRKTREQLTNIYVKHCSTDKTYNQFHEALERDRFLEPHEVVEWGLADEVLAGK